MTTVLASFITLLLAVGAMAVGVFFGRAPIRGSCGGANGGGCGLCAGTCERRAREHEDDVAKREKDAC